MAQSFLLHSAVDGLVIVLISHGDFDENCPSLSGEKDQENKDKETKGLVSNAGQFFG